MVFKKIYISNVVNIKENVEIEEAINETGHGRYNFYLLISCCILNIGATLDLLGFNVIVPYASCDLNLTLAESGLLMSISQAGFLSALPWAYMADARGRKPTILLSGTIGFIISVISSFSTSFNMMVVLKFIASTFSAISFNLSAVFLGENTCLKYRTRYLLILNVAHFAADFICFVMAFLILPLDFAVPFPFINIYKPWRLLTLVFCIPIAIGTILICFLQESPKFLAIKKPQQAIASLKNMYKINYGMKNVYPVKSVMKINEISENESFMNSIKRQIVPIFQLPLLWRTIQLFSLLTICISTSNIFYTWSPAMMNSFFTSESEDVHFCQKIVTNISPIRYNETCVETSSINTIYSGMIYTFLIALLNIAAVAFSNCRRVMIIGACLISGICCIVVDMVHHTVGSLVVFFLIQIVGVTYGSVQSYFIDVYPTSCRVLATSLGYMIARFSCLAGVSLVGAIIVDYCQLTFYCWAIYIFCGILVAIFLPGNEISKELSMKNEQS